ncbi:MAG: RluA family pseudouridine synthase [Lachnospiraceae bacterium]|nr:RluA family pseudouridine synthase [Lachnospiraceae bacterium]
MTEYRTLIYTAKKSDAGLMARDVIHREFHLVAHDIASAKYEIEDGITIDGESVMINHTLKEGNVLAVKLMDRPSGKTVPAPGPLTIVFENEDLVVIDKPAGVVVHPSHGHFADSIGNFLAWHYQEEGEIHEVRTMGRLDKDTSGLILFGKSRTVCAHMLKQAEEGLRTKEYLALASGTFESVNGDVDAPISREYEEKMKRVVREDGDRALTHYRVLRQYDGYALLSVTIETGRTHQIRVHMAHIGHPLLGDPIYGTCVSEDQDPEGPKRALLHAYKVSFLLPFKGDRVTFVSPLPEDMRRLCPGFEYSEGDVET